MRGKLPISRKITFVILTISLSGILISGLFSNYALSRQFQNYLNQSQLNRERQIVQFLAEMYQDNGGWDNVATRLNMRRRIFFGTLRYIADSKGRVVLVVRFNRTPPRVDNALHSYPIIVENHQVGTAYFGQTRFQNLLSRQDRLFREAINYSIFWSILITGIISILVAYIFAKRLAKPITEMNQLARNMTNGNLETRVNNLPQDELGELGRSINQLAEKLQQVQELRKKMTADVAHDLRTPLATVQSHLEGMIDSVIPASPENLESLLEEINRLTALVNDLQAIALTDSAILKFKQETVNLESFLNDMVKKMEPLFTKKGVRLKLESSTPVQISSDHDALAKILDNLLSNALKFTPPGKKVLLQLESHDNQVTIRVKDEGIGIAEDDLPFIFERFYRTDQSRNRDSGGFGLGLTIVKELVVALNGTISVTSKLGEGSIFTITFPTTR